MGRFTAYDQNGRMVADFDKSEYDFLCRYGRTPEEVLDENAKLWTLLKHESGQVEKLRELVRYIMHQCNDGNPRCDECIGYNDGECVALLRMRELGVGVDEC